MKKNKIKILPGLTTTKGSVWRDKLKEIRRYDLREIALFPTVLEEEERKELYRELEKVPHLRIPHVHLRSDMKLWELDYLFERFGVEVFNAHSAREYQPLHDHSKYHSRIYLENAHLMPTRNELLHSAGLCIDFSHWENGIRFDNPDYINFEEKAADFAVGCGHISAVKDNPFPHKDHFQGEHWRFESHWLDKISELKYIQKYLRFLPEVLSIELANPIKTQLQAKEYLERIISGD